MADRRGSPQTCQVNSVRKTGFRLRRSSSPRLDRTGKHAVLPALGVDHYSDADGFTDFGLRGLFGFRFPTRMRNIRDANLYLLPERNSPQS